MKKGAKIFFTLAILVVGYFAINYGVSSGLIPLGKVAPSYTPTGVNTPDAPISQVNSDQVSLDLPTSIVTPCKVPQIRFDHWAWNSQAALILANGGPTTTQGSLMEKHGVCLKFQRVDPIDKMQADLLTFAEELQTNPQPTKGAHFIAIMGDATAMVVSPIYDKLIAMGPEYAPIVIGSAGRSFGEDKFMGPQSWKDDPQTARGGVVSGVIRDGDWNIAVKWCADNGIPVNPSEQTYDPNALNFVNCSDYIEAAQKYLTNPPFTEDRFIVQDGKRKGTKRVSVQGVVTWTPGDVMIAQQKGGLVSIASTYEYSGQMPNTIIGIKKWCEANRPEVEGMLAAMFEAADMHRTFPQARKKASELCAVVFNEKGADDRYWLKYFSRVQEPDAQGLMVWLGGSAVHNLADNMQLFGITPGSSNLFGATYQTFADVCVAMYPDLMPTYPPLYSILNTSFIEGVAQKAGAKATKNSTLVPSYDNTPITETVSKKSWSINFVTGSAKLTPEAVRELQKLKNDLLIAQNLSVEIHGHTDNTGTYEGNMQLSQSRADAVKQWLEAEAPTNFPANRIRVFAHGQDKPIAANTSEFGRSQNRRVEIILGN